MDKSDGASRLLGAGMPLTGLTRQSMASIFTTKLLEALPAYLRGCRGRNLSTIEDEDIFNTKFVVS
jgi:hypothetical protein